MSIEKTDAEKSAESKVEQMFEYGYRKKNYAPDELIKDENGNPIPVKIAGFRQHGGGLSAGMIAVIIAGVIVLGILIVLLVRIIRKNQLTREEHEALRDTEEEPYESMAGDTEEDSTLKKE